VTIDVDDVDGLHLDLARRGVRIIRPPKDESYGLRVLDVADLDGSMLFFGTELKTAQR
jgi:hypothetical protein